MVVVSETVRHAASLSLSGDVLAELLDVLAAYRDAEAERVQLAVLALAGGDRRKVYDLVAAANQDYRDVLWWAETPDVWCHYEPELDRQEMAARYAALGVPVPVTLRSGGET